jgi:methylmalonyl-CoA mutase N-terminal domain/subunit
VGAQGVPLSTLDDMLKMYEGIDMENYTSSFSNTWVGVFALFLAAAETKGARVSEVRGSFQTDPLSSYPTGYDIDFYPDYSLRLPMDAMEFCIDHDMNWTPIVTNTYDIREMGVTAAEEAGYGIACALGYLERAVSRGMEPAEVAPRIAAISSAHIDIFEEVAKFRAMRRAWSYFLTNRFGIEDGNAKRLTIPVHTAGSWCFREQPINNVIRAAYQALAATLGGARAMDIASFDEPTRLPSEEASRVALRTQQILAHEVNIGGTADPLGGSYFIESLTDDIFDEILEIVDAIDSRGGMVEAVNSGWFKRTLEDSSSELQREIDPGERVVVGKNCYQIDREDELLDIGQQGESEPNLERIEVLNKHRAQRADGPLHDRLWALYEDTADGKNVVRPMIEAAKAQATLGELLGTVRVAHGYSFDPLGMVEPPIEF